MNYRELTAPELVKRWKAIVNDHVMVGRDAHMIKELLEIATPVQVLYGIYQYKGVNSITVPQFVKSVTAWLEEDKDWAEVELCRYITNTTPKEYYEYKDLVDEQGAYAFEVCATAKQSLKLWADRILA